MLAVPSCSKASGTTWVFNKPQGKQEVCEAGSAPASWDSCGHLACCIWGSFVTPAALLSPTCVPQTFLWVLSPLPQDWLGLGQEWAEHRAALQCNSLYFYPEKLLLPWSRWTVLCITCHIPNLLFIHRLPSWSRIYKPNFDFSPQRYPFPFLPVSPLSGLIKASKWLGREGVS